MPATRMSGSLGFTAAEKERMWDLHVTHKLAAKTIALRMGVGINKVAVFLKARREENGVTVKIDRFKITRPI